MEENQENGEKRKKLAKKGLTKGVLGGMISTSLKDGRHFESE